MNGLDKILDDASKRNELRELCEKLTVEESEIALAYVHRLIGSRLESKTIYSFDGKYRFLSNFYLSSVEFEGRIYSSVEHAYQAAKTSDDTQRYKISLSLTPSEAKQAGRNVRLRPDWEFVKIPIMRSLIQKKFENPVLAAMLRNTGNAELIEGNWWNDTFWGMCNGVGQNWLGRILMEARESLRTQ